jgi:hypothetical protein
MWFTGEPMITRDQIVEALMDPTERGTRAVGRALVLLYGKHYGGKHQNPMGVSAAGFYLQFQTLTRRQLEFWREPLKSGDPHICLHADELLEIAKIKQTRKKQLIDDGDELVQHILNTRDELLDHAQSMIRSNEPSTYRHSLMQLREWEYKHQITPTPLPNVTNDIEQDIRDELMNKMKA